jgi:hypothetical protein
MAFSKLKAHLRKAAERTQRAFAAESAASYLASNPTNAPINSPMRDIFPYERNPL